MAKNSNYFSADAFSGLDDSLANKLSGLQQSISKLGLRKERYTDTIRQALRDGRLKEQDINRDFRSKLDSMTERMAAKGLGKSGAGAMLSAQMEKDAAVARKKATIATADAISSAQSQIKQLTAEQNMGQQEAQRLLYRATLK